MATNLIEKVFTEQKEDAALWKAPIEIPVGCNSEKISPARIVSYLDLTYPGFEPFLSSIESHTWLSYQDGKFLVEIPHEETFNKKLRNNGGTVIMSDFDDTLFSTTEWHDIEYEIILDYLRLSGVDGNKQDIATLYELSKVLIPKIAETQPRYTPRLNFILIHQFIKRQKENHVSSFEALELMKDEQKNIQERLYRMGEHSLSDYQFEADLVRTLITANPTDQFLHTPLIQDLFGGNKNEDDTALRIIITRGKIEGPLGQVYKVHQSQIMTLPTVDAVVYTNDIKLQALLGLDILLPTLKKNRSILIYDDNPSEIVPFFEVLSKKCPFNLELIHVRHNSAKRRDKKVMTEHPKTEIDPIGTIGYRYQQSDSSVIETFSEAEGADEATIFEHHVIGGKGMSAVI